MSDDKPIDELGVVLQEDGPKFFMECLYDLPMRARIGACVKKHSWGRLTPSELAEVVQDVYLAVWQKVNNPDFTTARPERMVFVIARNKAIDARRKKTASAPETNTELVEYHAKQDFAGSKLGDEWALVDSFEKAEFKTALLEIISNLPTRQRIVAECFCEIYEDLRERKKYKPLAEAVSRRTGNIEDVVSVKSSWQAARSRIKDELCNRGFGFIERDNV